MRILLVSLLRRTPRSESRMIADVLKVVSILLGVFIIRMIINEIRQK